MASIRKTVYFYEPRIIMASNVDFAANIKDILKSRAEMLKKYGPLLEETTVSLTVKRELRIIHSIRKTPQYVKLFVEKPTAAKDRIDLIPVSFQVHIKDGWFWHVTLIDKKGRVVDGEIPNKTEA